MMKKLGLATVALSVLLLSGCGGSSKSTAKKLKNVNGIIIFHNSITGTCLTENISGLVGLKLYEESNNVSCATYGRTTTSDAKGEYCREEIVEEGGNTACVVGFDDFSGSGQREDSELLLGSVPVFNQ